MVATLREIGFSEVFYAGEKRPKQEWPEDAFIALSTDLREIRKAGAFVLLWPNATPSSALLELGYAIALRKHILILVRDPNHLPFLVRATSQLANVRRCEYRDADDLARLLREHKADLFGDSPDLGASPDLAV